MSEKDQNDMLKELAALDGEKNTFYARMREGKFDEIIKSLEPAAEPKPGAIDVEIAKADKKFEGDDEPAAPKKAPIKATEEKEEDDDGVREPTKGYEHKMGDKTGYDTSAADKPKPATTSTGSAKNMEDAKQIERHERAKWGREDKKIGKPLQGPPHELRTGANKKQVKEIQDRAFHDNLRSGQNAPKKGEDYGNKRKGETDADSYYRQHLGEDIPSEKEENKSDLSYMWDNTLPGVRGEEAEEAEDTPKDEKNKKIKAQGTQKHSFEGKIKERKITANKYFGLKDEDVPEIHRTADNAAYWRKILGKAFARAMMKSLDVMAEYMYTSVGETLNKSLYSDYESDLVELIKSEFEQERDIAIEEIVKMVMQDDEYNADFDEIEKAIEEAEADDDEIVKAFNAMADAIVAIAEDMELMKSAIAGDDDAFEEIAKSVKKKKKHPLNRFTPNDSTKKEPDEVDLEDEGEEEVKKSNGGSDSSDSKECVRKGDITTKDLKSHTEEGVIPKSSPQPVNKTAFEEGKKIGAIEAIQKSVADNGVATLPPGETVNQERLDPIAKMLNDNSTLLNTSFRALEKTIRNPEKN